MDVRRIALIASIEANKQNTNWQKKTSPFIHMYEDEAIRCFTNWRKNGGWLKDISIYALCSTKNFISDSTKKLLEQLNVNYIEHYDERASNYSSGFLTLPYCGKYFSQANIIPEDILLRIDLDMNLLKPLDEKLFDGIDDSTIIGQYDIDSLKDQRTSYQDALPFDTGFMITHKKNRFYDVWYDLCFSDEILNSNEWISIRKDLGDYYLEEFVVDYMYHNSLMKITPIQKYQYGEGYASIDTFTDEQIKNLYFCHEHMYIDKKFPWNYDSVSEHIKYLKRLNK